jgi:RNA-binding protein 26
MHMMGMLQGGFHMPWMPSDGNSGTIGYDPNEARMDMSVPPPPIPGTLDQRGSRPANGTAQNIIDVPTGDGLDDRDQGSGAPPYMTDQAASGMLMSQPFPSNTNPTDVNVQMDQQAGSYGVQRGGRGAHRGRGRGGPSGTFAGQHDSSFSGGPRDKASQRDNKTIVIEKIPAEHLSLGAINDWFKRFGTVTNVAVDAHTSKALVSFVSHEEAHKAWKSEDAVFGNRFVKVFWHRPLAGHGEAGKRALDASAPVVKNMSGRVNNTFQPPASSKEESRTSDPSTSVDRAQQMRVLLEDQKGLFAALDAATSEEKIGIKAKIKSIMAELDRLRHSPLPAASAVSKAVEEHGQLDNKSDAQGGLASNSSATGASSSERRDDLMAQLEELKKEVYALL